MAKGSGLTFSDGKNSSSNEDLTFTSWVKNVDEVNAGMDIIALTSKNEGTPVSLIEAQASNKPIVTTNVGGIEDIVLVDETALLSNAQDQSHFNSQLLKLVENQELREVMGAKGWGFVKERFHFNRLVQEFDELYAFLLKQKGL